MCLDLPYSVCFRVCQPLYMITFCPYWLLLTLLSKWTTLNLRQQHTYIGQRTPLNILYPRSLGISTLAITTWISCVTWYAGCLLTNWHWLLWLTSKVFVPLDSVVISNLLSFCKWKLWMKIHIFSGPHLPHIRLFSHSCQPLLYLCWFSFRSSGFGINFVCKI